MVLNKFFYNRGKFVTKLKGKFFNLHNNWKPFKKNTMIVREITKKLKMNFNKKNLILNNLKTMYIYY